MKYHLKYLLIILISPLFLMGQEKNDIVLQKELIQLRRKVLDQQEHIRELKEKNQTLETQLQVLSEDLDQKLKKNMELQAQNERAVNITLDEFSGKFEEQNKTVKGVKESLDKQLIYQIIFYSAGIILFLIILWLGIQLAVRRALKQQTNRWNEFNEHILKNY